MVRLPSSIRPWALMLLMLAAATVLRGALDPILGSRAPLLTYYPLTVFLALFAGRWPAAVSVVLSVLLSGLLFGPAGSVAQDAVALAIYIPANAVLIVLIERVRRAGEGARRREERSAERVSSSPWRQCKPSSRLESQGVAEDRAGASLRRLQPR